MDKGGERRLGLSVDSGGRGSTEVGDSFSAGRAGSVLLHLVSALSPFRPSFRVMSEPAYVPRLGDGEGRLAPCIIFLKKLATHDRRESSSEVVSTWVKVGEGSVPVTSE